VSASAPHGTVWHEWPGSSFLSWDRGMATPGTAVTTSFGSGHHCPLGSRRSATVPACERGSLVTHFNASAASYWRRRTVAAGPRACRVPRRINCSGGFWYPATTPSPAAPAKVVPPPRCACSSLRIATAPVALAAGQGLFGDLQVRCAQELVAVTISRGEVRQVCKLSTLRNTRSLCVRRRPQRRCQTASTDRTGLIS